MKNEYCAEAKSREELRDLASQVREIFNLREEIYFPIERKLDLFCFVFEKLNYEIVPDSDMPDNIHAETDIIKHHIRIKESVYNGATEGNGRDRMTIAHEFAHYILICICGVSLKRNYGDRDIPAYQSPEWQAKCLAGELLIPENLTKDMSAEEIRIKCGVSAEAAAYQYKVMNREGC